MRKVSSRPRFGPIPSSYFTLLEKLKGSKFCNKSDLDALADSFDTGMKTAFSDNTKLQKIKFCGLRDHNKEFGIKDGKLAIAG